MPLDCSCYEIAGGHQPGCVFHGLSSQQIQQLAGTEILCPDCSDSCECPSCGRENPEQVKECPHCGSLKCSTCDMGDDVECPSCEMTE